MTVHIAARVMAQAGHGEILVTAATRDLTDGAFEFDDRGSFELKGVPGARTLFAVRI
jgi:class 3 adenylate cyclase